jgi:hypothetical protein
MRRGREGLTLLVSAQTLLGILVLSGWCGVGGKRFRHWHAIAASCGRCCVSGRTVERVAVRRSVGRHGELRWFDRGRVLANHARGSGPFILLPRGFNHARGSTSSSRDRAIRDPLIDSLAYHLPRDPLSDLCVCRLCRGITCCTKLFRGTGFDRRDGIGGHRRLLNPLGSNRGEADLLKLEARDAVRALRLGTVNHRRRRGERSLL